MSLFTIIAVASLIMWLVLTFAVASDASARGHDPLVWGGASLLLGIFGSVLYVVVRDPHPDVVVDRGPDEDSNVGEEKDWTVDEDGSYDKEHSEASDENNDE